MLIIEGNEIKMGTAKNNAGILNGVNTCIGWDAHFKENLSIDNISDSSVTNSINIINDRDHVDFKINKK